MSRKESVDHVLGRARQARARLAPAAARVKPLAGKAGTATARRVRKTRAWAAPQVKRAGEALQDNVAPKISAMMSSAAERIDPDQPRRGRGSGPAGTARLRRAAKATAIRLRGRARRASAAPADEADEPVVADTVASPGEAQEPVATDTVAQAAGESG